MGKGATKACHELSPGSADRRSIKKAGHKGPPLHNSLSQRLFFFFARFGFFRSIESMLKCNQVFARLE